MLVIVSLIAVGPASYGQSQKKGHLTITPGVDFATMTSTDNTGTRVYFPDGTNFRIGAMFEIPVWSNKWSAIIEPALQRYTARSPLELRYRSLETQIGIRRYIKINRTTGLFINGAIVGDIPFVHSMEFAPSLAFNASGMKTNFVGGAGLSFHRFTLEYRRYTRRNRRDNTGSFRYNYDKQSIILGFRLY